MDKSPKNMVEYTQQEVELGRRARAFGLMPGMCVIVSKGVLLGSAVRLRDGQHALDYAQSFDPGSFILDVRDPATRGCLLEITRRAWNDPGLTCVSRRPLSFSDIRSFAWVICGGAKYHGGTFNRMVEVFYDSEAEALVSALETALRAFGAEAVVREVHTMPAHDQDDHSDGGNPAGS